MSSASGRHFELFLESLDPFLNSVCDLQGRPKEFCSEIREKSKNQRSVHKLDKMNA